MDPESTATSSSSGLKFLLAEIAIIAFIIVVALGVLNYFSIVSLANFAPGIFSSLPQQNQSSPGQLTALPVGQNPPVNSLPLPVPLDNPNVVSAAILYNITGVIQNVETLDNQTIITLQQKDTQIPPLTLLGTTNVRKQVRTANTTTIEQAEFSDLAANQEIALTAIYAPSTQKWSAYNVFILDTSLTPSP